MIDLSELSVILDSREEMNRKVQSRTERIKEFVERYGGGFSKEYLENGKGLDIAVSGYYNGHEINLGIEYKSWQDFVSTYAELRTRLGSAREIYDHIAIIIEGESKASTSREMDSGMTWYLNPAVPDGKANHLMNTQIYRDLKQVWAECGVILIEISDESGIPQAILDILHYAIRRNDSQWVSDHRIALPETSYRDRYLNMLLACGIHGLGLKKAEKLISFYPNPFWLISSCDFDEIVGNKLATELYSFFRSNELEATNKKLSTHDNHEVEITTEAGHRVISTHDNSSHSTEDKNPSYIQSPISSSVDDKVPVGQLADRHVCNVEALGSNPGGHTSQSPHPILEHTIPPVCGDKEQKEVIPPSAPFVSDPPDNKDFHEEIYLRDVIEFIRKRQRTFDEVGKEFGFTENYCLKVLLELKKKQKIWYNTELKVWDFGHDKNPMQVTADKEFDIGV